MAEDKSKAGKTALKVHHSAEPYLREGEVYQRLKDAGVSEILGFNVPQLIRFDDELRIIEMSIVARPFVLDFAGAYFDTPPDFPEEKWADWEAEKREQFGTLWPRVQAVLEALEALEFTWSMYRPATSRSWTECRLSGIPLALIFVVENKAAGCFRTSRRTLSGPKIM